MKKIFVYYKKKKDGRVFWCEYHGTIEQAKEHAKKNGFVFVDAIEM